MASKRVTLSIPLDLYRALATLAKKHRLPLQQYIYFTLGKSVNAQKKNKKTRKGEDTFLQYFTRER